MYSQITSPKNRRFTVSLFFTYACLLHLITENWKVSNKYKQYSNYKFAARPYLKSFTKGPSSDLALLKVYQKRQKSESGILIIMVKVFSIKNINTMHAMRVYTSREIGSSLIPFPHSIPDRHQLWCTVQAFSFDSNNFNILYLFCN
jgi:hypothetical protein